FSRWSRRPPVSLPDCATTQALAGFAALDLDATAALFEVSRSLLLRVIADLDVVYHLCRARRLGHASGRPLVLNHFGGSIPIGHAALDAYGESVLADFGFRQSRADLGLDLNVLWSGCALRSDCFGFGLGKGARQRERQQQNHSQHAELVARTAKNLKDSLQYSSEALAA